MIFKAIIILTAIKIFMELFKNGWNELVTLQLILLTLVAILLEIRKKGGLE